MKEYKYKINGNSYTASFTLSPLSFTITRSLSALTRDTVLKALSDICIHSFSFTSCFTISEVM